MSSNIGKRLGVYNERDELDDIIKEELIDSEKLISSKTFTIRLQTETLYNYFDKEPEAFLASAKHSVKDWITQYKYPIKPEDVRIVIDSSYLIVKKMRELKADSYYKPVCFDAVVVGEGSIKTYIKKATCICPSCSNKATFEVTTSDKILEPFCQKCKEQTNLCEELCVFGELKDIIIREPFGDFVDKQPIEYSCKARDELVSRLHVGKKVRIVGMRRALTDRAKKNEYQIEVRIFSEEDLGDPKDLLPTDEEIQAFETDSTKPEFEKDVVNSFSPDVYCTDESILWFIKYALLLLALGGNEVEGKRQYINGLLVGDPGVTKSTMMKNIVAITPRSMYVSGNGASEAGLTAIIEKQADGKFMVKAGILPMCDGGGIAAVDEMNLMEPEHQNALQETMENQFVTKAKAVNAILPARCSVLGGANPVFGKYDFDKSVIENLEMSTPLLNRFDIKFNVIDEVNQVLDTAIAKHILEYQRNAKKILDSVRYSKLDLIKFLNYARKIQPELTDEAEKEIISFVNRIRSLTNNKDSMPIDKRIIESLIRLVIARAKLLLKKKVGIEDVQFISKLYLKSLNSFGINTESEITQNTFHDTKQLNQLETWWTVFDSCMDSEGTVDKVEVIAKLAETKHFDEYKAKSFFEKMISKSVISELRNGRWRKV